MTGETGFQRVGGLTEIPGLLRQLGCDPEAVLLGAGVDPLDLAHVENKIPYSAATRMLRECARHTGLAHFALLAGQRWRISHQGVLGDAMKSARTVADALQVLAAGQHRNSNVGAPFVLEHQGSASLGYAVYAKGVESLDQAYDVAVAYACNILRELCGPGWDATEVRFARSEPEDQRPYREHFRAPLRFDQDQYAVCFSAQWLERPLAGAVDAPPAVSLALIDTAEDAELAPLLYRTLRLLLLSGKSSGDDLARTLMMHRRTLNRRLRGQGTTFQKVLDDVRFEVARQLLEQAQTPIPDIAAALCYSEVSAFNHAFRRWTGTTPSDWRRTSRRS